MNLVASTDLNTPRSECSLSRLGDGQMIVIGGLDHLGNALGSAEIFNPATGLWTVIAASLATPRYAHAAVVIGGAVFVIGGFAAGGGYLSSVEIFNENGRADTLGAFRAAATGLTSARAHMAARALPDGRILVVGGVDSGDTALATAEIYAPGI